MYLLTELCGIHPQNFQYFHRTKTDPATGNLMGVERRPVQMFPLIVTGGIKFEF